MHLMTDAELVKRVRSGDEAAYQVLWDKYVRLVWRVAFRITHDRYDADDVVQDTFHTIWKKPPNNDGRADLEQWVRRTATNRAIDLLRHRDVQERVFVVLAGGEDGLLAPEGDRRIQGDEVRRAMEKAMTDLSAWEKALLYLRYVEQMSAAEIGERLGTDAPAVRMAVYRAGGKLRSALKRQVE